LVEAKTKVAFWICRFCDAKHKADGIYKTVSTSGPERHLAAQHGIKKLKRKEAMGSKFVKMKTLGMNRGFSITSNNSVQFKTIQPFSRLV